MTYRAVAAMSTDDNLLARIAAAAVTEGESDPEMWAQDHRWVLAAQPGWGDAYASALAAHNEDPGNDETVITDAMILSAVQGLRTAEDSGA